MFLASFSVLHALAYYHLSSPATFRSSSSVSCRREGRSPWHRLQSWAVRPSDCLYSIIAQHFFPNFWTLLFFTLLLAAFSSLPPAGIPSCGPGSGIGQRNAFQSHLHSPLVSLHTLCTHDHTLLTLCYERVTKTMRPTRVWSNCCLLLLLLLLLSPRIHTHARPIVRASILEPNTRSVPSARSCTRV